MMRDERAGASADKIVDKLKDDGTIDALREAALEDLEPFLDASKERVTDFVVQLLDERKDFFLSSVGGAKNLTKRKASVYDIVKSELMQKDSLPCDLSTKVQDYLSSKRIRGEVKAKIEEALVEEEEEEEEGK